MTFLQRLLSSNPSSPAPLPPPEQKQTPSNPVPSLSNSTTTTPAPNSEPPPQQSSSISPYQNQLIFFAGVAFVGLSTLVTRRSIVNRQRSIFPRFYHPSNAPPEASFSGARDAYDAFSIATVNVFSYTLLWTGGLLWAFDIRGWENLRWRLRRGFGFDGIDSNDAEEEFQEWLAETLSRKEEKSKRRLERRGDGGEGGNGEEGLRARER